MTYATEKVKVGRRLIQVVELDLDFCDLVYSNAPCTAALGITGLAKCFNSRGTCQDPDNYTPSAKTYRFSTPVTGVPRSFDAIPSVRSIKSTPVKLDPGRTLGKRGKVVVTFQDHPHHDRGIDKYVSERADGTAGTPAYTPYDQGSFFGKLRARNPHYQGRIMRVRTGFLPWDHDLPPGGQATATEAAVNANLIDRTYIIEQFNGPDANGKFTITGKDLLKLAEDARAECPIRNTGVLDADILAGTLDGIVSSYDSAAFDKTITPAAPFTTIQDAKVFNSGVHLFLSYSAGGPNRRFIGRFTMSTPKDLSTAVEDVGQATEIFVADGKDAQAVFMRADGLKLFLGDDTPAEVFSYTLTVPWDLTTATYDGAGKDYSLADQANSIELSADGKTLLVFSIPGDTIRSHSLSTAWDLATASQKSSAFELDLSVHQAAIESFAFNSDGTILAAVGFEGANDTVYWYSLGAPYDLSSAIYKGVGSDTDISGEHTQATFIGMDDTKIYVGASLGRLFTSYSWNIAAGAVLSPTGIGDLEYAANGTVRIKDEIMTFTRSGDDLTFTERGTDNTDAADHSAGDEVQQCHRFQTKRIEAIIQELLEDFSGVSPADIPISEWATEAATYLPTFIFSTIISEPTGVSALLNELSEQALCVVYWDESAGEFKFRALRTEDVALTVTDGMMLDGSFSQVDNPARRLTRVAVKFARLNSITRLDDPTNFLLSHQEVSAFAESSDEYGDKRLLTINSRWFGEGDVVLVQSFAKELLARYEAMPAVFSFALGAKDASVRTGEFIKIQTQHEGDIFGATGFQVAQIIEVRELQGGAFGYKAISVGGASPDAFSAWAVPSFWEIWGGTPLI